MTPFPDARIHLVEAGPRVLSTFPEVLSNPPLASSPVGK